MTPCILHKGRTNGKRGYGLVSTGRKNGKPTSILAHRLAWIKAYGPIPKGKWVLHKCDVRLCINPKHLFLGTAKDNTQDAIRKGRFAAPPMQRLNAEQVMEIRRSSESIRVLSERYKIGKSMVSAILLKKRWKNLRQR